MQLAKSHRIQFTVSFPIFSIRSRTTRTYHFLRTRQNNAGRSLSFENAARDDFRLLRGSRQSDHADQDLEMREPSSRLQPLIRPDPIGEAAEQFLVGHELGGAFLRPARNAE